jgi:N-acetylglucosaminyl-diphospho-decaprenol L-rhamnosyltransferase
MSTEDAAMHDVCAIVVSHNGKRWLDTALSSLYAHRGEIDLDVVLVDNGEDGSAEHVARHFPEARTLRCENRGFGHANNRGLEIADARYVLFINPDTEVREGELADLIAELDRQPRVGLAGARQLRPDGSLAPSIRRFPSAMNMLAEALGIERIPGARRRFGERELDQREYARQRPCDWTSGSFMLVRQAALEEVGDFDERFFLYCEETDLCWRLKRAEWDVVHLPQMTICHFEDDRRGSAELEAQAAYARMQFARKHFPDAAADYRWAMALRYGLRVGLYSLRGRRQSPQRLGASAALSTVIHGNAPFGS